MEMQRLRPNAAEIKKRLLGAKENLLKYQRQRQKDIWGLLTKATSQVIKRAEVNLHRWFCILRSNQTKILY